MKAIKLRNVLAIAVATLSIGTAATRAATINLDFSYVDSNGIVNGQGTFTAKPLFGVQGGYLATAGSLVLKAPAADGISGTYSLFTNPSAPNSSYSPTGQFIYDDLIFPGGNPVVTNPGILGFGGNAPGGVPEGKGREINLFSNGNNTYDLYTAVGGQFPYSYEFTIPEKPAAGSKFVWSTMVAGATAGTGNIHASVVAAPEPATWVIMGSFLLIGLRMARSRNGDREVI
jgi:hypothetical protein